MTESRNYLDVPYSEKDEAKKLGAKWDAVAKSWYIPSGMDKANFSRWTPQEKTAIYIVVGHRECWKCHKDTSVVALGIPYGDTYALTVEDVQDGLFSAYDPSTYEALALVPRIDSMPKELRDYLQKEFNYKPKYSNTTKLTALNNCCDNCDALIGEFFEFEEPSGTFFITNIDDLKRLEFYEVELSGVIYGLLDRWSSEDELIYRYARENAKKVAINIIENIYL